MRGTKSTARRLVHCVRENRDEAKSGGRVCGERRGAVMACAVMAGVLMSVLVGGGCGVIGGAERWEGDATVGPFVPCGGGCTRCRTWSVTRRGFRSGWCATRSFRIGGSIR